MQDCSKRVARSHLSRCKLALIVCLGLSCLLGTESAKRQPLIVYNASASVPIGFYRITPVHSLSHGDLVLVRTPEAVRQLADTRHYLPKSVSMLKHIAALKSDVVCARDTDIFINGVGIVTRQRTDSFGRAMPWWTGCTRLKDGEVFLLNALAPRSFDGRYFGVSKVSDIIGKAVRL